MNTSFTWLPMNFLSWFSPRLLPRKRFREAPGCTRAFCAFGPRWQRSSRRDVRWKKTCVGVPPLFFFFFSRVCGLFFFFLLGGQLHKAILGKVIFFSGLQNDFRADQMAHETEWTPKWVSNQVSLKWRFPCRSPGFLSF